MGSARRLRAKAAKAARAESRLAPARRRARIAKSAIGAVGAVGFGAAMVLARGTYTAHAKTPPKSLSAPLQFLRIVRQNQLEAGIVAPAEAPPDAATSVS